LYGWQNHQNRASILAWPGAGAQESAARPLSPLPRETVSRLDDDLRVFLTYHPNAIEGNTLSLRETQMVLEYGITVHGQDTRCVSTARPPIMPRSLAL